MKALHRSNNKLLVVDDIAANRELLIRYFGARGFEMAEADDGSTALRMIKQQHFDAVLLDILMPGIDGIEVLKRIRAAYTLTELPVIMISALNARLDIRLALDLGANDYVSKPVDLVLALTKLQRAIGASPDQQARPVVKQCDPNYGEQLTKTDAPKGYAAEANLNRREMRGKTRRRLQRGVWILIDKQPAPIRCTAVDISVSGACVVLQTEEDLPNRFALSLAEDGTARRICRLVWQNGLRVGLEFTGEATETGNERQPAGASVDLLL